MMTVFIALVLVVLTLAFITYPFFKDRRRQLPPKRKTAYTGVREMDNLAQDTEVEVEIEKQVQKLRQSKRFSCSQCGTQYQEADRFCSHCGAPLRSGGHGD